MSIKCRDSFVFYRSFQYAIDEMGRAEQLKIYRAIAEYSLDHTEPQLRGKSAIVWGLIKAQLDANWRKYSDGCKGAESGKLGGRPRKNPIGFSAKTPNDNVNVNDNSNENVNDNGEDSEFGARQLPLPSISDIEAYIARNNLAVEPTHFYDYYASNGWKIGKNQMADWRAALRIWSRKTEQDNNNHQRVLSNDL